MGLDPEDVAAAPAAGAAAAAADGGGSGGGGGGPAAVADGGGPLPPAVADGGHAAAVLSFDPYNPAHIEGLMSNVMNKTLERHISAGTIPKLGPPSATFLPGLSLIHI